MPHLKLTAREVKDALLRRHGMEIGDGAWACVEEAFSGWRSAGGGIDLFAMACHSSARRPGMSRHKGPDGDPVYGRVEHPIVSYEVKVSRSDFRRELRGAPRRGFSTTAGPWPAKARHALARSHHFVFAVPAGLLSPAELGRREPWPTDDPTILKGGLWVPPEAGLVEIGADGKVRVKVEAPRLEPRPLEAHEIAELLRHGTTPASMRNAVATVARLRERIEWLEGRLVERDRELEDATEALRDHA